MNKILDKIGNYFFWGVMIFIIVGGIIAVVNEGIVAVPGLLFCCFTVGAWIWLKHFLESILKNNVEKKVI